MNNLWLLSAVPVFLPNWGPFSCFVALETIDTARLCTLSNQYQLCILYTYPTSWVCTLKLHGRRWKSSGLSHPSRVSQSWGRISQFRSQEVKFSPGHRQCLAWGTFCERACASFSHPPPCHNPNLPSSVLGGTEPRLCWTPKSRKAVIYASYRIGNHI